jgi:hypothetical protein
MFAMIADDVIVKFGQTKFYVLNSFQLSNILQLDLIPEHCIVQTSISITSDQFQSDVQSDLKIGSDRFESQEGQRCPVFCLTLAEYLSIGVTFCVSYMNVAITIKISK